VYKSY